MNCNTYTNKQLKSAADFILNCPLREIGNESVQDIVESFKYECLNKHSAIELMLNHHKNFLEKYINIQQKIYYELLK